MRYTYIFGIKTIPDAIEAWHEAFSAGQIGAGERPSIEPYKTKNRKTGKTVTRYQITLEA